MIKRDSVFSWYICNNTIIIKELETSSDLHISVTNNIENVISIVNKELNGIGNRKVIYRDSDLIYDEVIIKDNRFSEFKCINTQSYLDAIKKVNK